MALKLLHRRSIAVRDGEVRAPSLSVFLHQSPDADLVIPNPLCGPLGGVVIGQASHEEVVHIHPSILDQWLPSVGWLKVAGKGR